LLAGDALLFIIFFSWFFWLLKAQKALSPGINFRLESVCQIGLTEVVSGTVDYAANCLVVDDVVNGSGNVFE
jgi:hypothetical protein